MKKLYILVALNDGSGGGDSYFALKRAESGVEHGKAPFELIEIPVSLQDAPFIFPEFVKMLEPYGVQQEALLDSLKEAYESLLAKPARGVAIRTVNLSFQRDTLESLLAKIDQQKTEKGISAIELVREQQAYEIFNVKPGPAFPKESPLVKIALWQYRLISKGPDGYALDTQPCSNLFKSSYDMSFRPACMRIIQGKLFDERAANDISVESMRYSYDDPYGPFLKRFARGRLFGDPNETLYGNKLPRLDC